MFVIYVDNIVLQQKGQAAIYVRVDDDDDEETVENRKEDVPPGNPQLIHKPYELH